MNLSNDISRHGYSNAKLADAALDSFVHNHQTLDEAMGCPGCQAELSKLMAGKPEPTDNVMLRKPVKAEPTNQMYQSLKATFAKCLGICERKSHDYARGENPYRNFEGSARIGVSVQKGLLVRLQDKFTRLENLIDTEAQVSDETFEDTIDDLINYAAILKARREFERTAK